MHTDSRRRLVGSPIDAATLGEPGPFPIAQKRTRTTGPTKNISLLFSPSSFGLNPPQNKRMPPGMLAPPSSSACPSNFDEQDRAVYPITGYLVR